MAEITTKVAAEKYGINRNTLRKAVQRKEFPVRDIDNKRVYLFDDESPEFQSWLARYQRRIKGMRQPSAATQQSYEYRQRYYREVTLPKRQAMRQAAQTA